MANRQKGKIDEETFSGVDFVIKLPPFNYVHILNTNTNVISVETGPKTFTCLDHEKLVYGPAKMVIVPPRHYVVIENPVIRKSDSDNPFAVEKDKYGQVSLRHGDQEVRLSQEPFPLFPGEKIVGNIQPLTVVEENTALRLRAKRDFVDRYSKGPEHVERKAGDEWLFKGLATYYPQSEVEIVQIVRAVILKSNQALKIKAADACVDYQGVKRKAGEEWLVRTEGAYLPGVNESIIETLNAIVLTDVLALHLRAIKSFKDSKGVDRKAGEEWMITRADSEAYIPDVNEQIIRQVGITVLNKRQYCIILDPVGEDGKPQLGARKLVKGEKSFFLKPGERLEAAVTPVYVLGADEALWVKAREQFQDGRNKRRPGDKWLVYGPGEYWPPLEVDVETTQKAFLKIEPLNIYYFQPVLFCLALFLIILALYLINKYGSLLLFGDDTPSTKTEL